ncbi:hypothetical protein Sjap_025904 [Stephania japonica]|uniref:Uncharacterized protein n=1 Tax=Stephania japonica TaxID=461633 RepID=A0AAP0EAD4_9MAGN
MVEAGEEIQTDGVLSKSYIRIRVEMDIDRPTMRGRYIRDEEDDNLIWVDYKYEKVKNFVTSAVDSPKRTRSVTNHGKEATIILTVMTNWSILRSRGWLVLKSPIWNTTCARCISRYISY